MESALELVEWLASRGFCILGGEIYERYEFGWGSYVSDWATEPGANLEAWDDYVEHAKGQATKVILDDIAHRSDWPLGARRLYFLAFCTKKELGLVVPVP